MAEGRHESKRLQLLYAKVHYYPTSVSWTKAENGRKAISFSEWAKLAQDRAGWLKLVTKAPFDIGKPRTAATAAPVRHQGHARAEAEGFG